MSNTGNESETSDRALAYVAVIKDLRPIEGADMIEVATVLGWNVVVKKGLYKVGDHVVYVEIDSILPPWPYFKNDKLDSKGYRIKTIKLRGQISQGYCIPIPELKNHPEKKIDLITVNSTSDTQLHIPALLDTQDNTLIPLEIGTDLTSYIGIKKFEVANTVIIGKSIGGFPDFIVKTDQVRIQNLPEYPELHADVEFEVTEKLEGTSITGYYHVEKQAFGICSRNLSVSTNDPDSVAAATLVHALNLPDRLTKYGKSIALQGELIGPGIQVNIYKQKTHQWMIFDVYLIYESRYATPEERTKILDELDWPTNMRAPVINPRMKIAGMDVHSILKMAEGISALAAGVQREGLVFKSHQLKKSETIHFKAISNAYELKRA